MLELISTGLEQTIGFTIKGKVESEDIDRVANIIEEKLKEHPKLRIYAEVEKMEGMSIRAFFKDLVFAWKHLRDFEKEVIVADGKWWSRFAQIGNKLVPGIEVKHFNLADKQQALQWIGS